MPVGEKLFKPILITKNDEPHIAERIISRSVLFIGFDKDKNYILFLG
tara:strand:+ start:94 stop:234 length:141 start_codon:yes stop_codon:yes gene_type:complete